MLGMLLICIFALVFATVFLLARASLAYYSEQTARRLLGAREEEPGQARDPFLQMFRPLYLLMLPLAENLAGKTQRYCAQASRKLVAASLHRQITVHEFLAFKLLMMVLFPVLGYGFFLLINRPLSWWLLLGLTVLGLYLPDLWLKQRVEQRAKAIRRALPTVVDLLALSVEGGMDFIEAIKRLIRKSKPSALIEELSLMVKQVDMMVPRDDALRKMAQDCDVNELNTFVSILVQSLRLGVPIRDILRSQSNQMLTQRFQRAERLAGEASQKIIFPLILCIMPAVFLVIIGPVILKLIY